MYAVILAGGSGTRLWPLSRELHPKQYLPLPVPGEKGSLNSLFQATFERVTAFIPPENVLVVTHRDQAGEVRRQLSLSGLSAVRLLEEPLARNTAPAIGLAACYLQVISGDEAVMAVLPSDHLITDHRQFSDLLERGKAAAKAYGLVTFGIRPTYPETGYGYICCGDKLDQDTCRVEKFVEKPDLKTAKAYLQDSRYLWNSGMFVFRVGALLEQYRRLLPEMHSALEEVDYSRFANLEDVYKNLEKISIDYGILERSEQVSVIPTSINWSDLGSWEAYYQITAKDKQGNYLQGRVIPVDTKNSLVISGSRLIATVGLNDLVVVDTDDALLVCSRDQTQDVKKIADRLKAEEAVEAREHRTIYRPWGSYTSLELAENYQVKRINVNPGARLSLQSHRRRSENWIVVSGEAWVTVDDQEFAVKKGERAYIPAGARHRMENRGKQPLVLIEVQSGDYLGEDDIERYEDDYGRASPAPAKNHPNNKSSALLQPGQERRPENRVNVLPAARQNYAEWLAQPGLDPDIKKELQAIKNDPAAINSHFGTELAFGTGGMRGVIGAGLNRINSYTIRRATQGLADYLNSLSAPSGPENPDASGIRKVAIAHDTRLYSDQFAETAALVLAANGIKALIFDGIRPTPMLSFITRELGCSAGIVITASHNPPQYNGFKVYGPDGGQAVSPLVDDLVRTIKEVDIFHDVQMITGPEASERGLLETIDPVYDSGYLEKVKDLSLSTPGATLKVVFTPLHGTGQVYIPGLLKQTGYIEFFPVEEQSSADPDFSTVHVPNPEDPAALEMALQKARQVEADLVLATDPDGDRVGTAVRDHSGSYVILSGNQVGALLIEYICRRLVEREEMPQEAVMIKTIVTGDLGKRIAESYGLQVIETLTGFKFIGAKIKEFEALGGPHFIFGYEESCGYLSGTFVRDKDAVISSCLIAEMSAYYKEKGKNLLQVLDDLQKAHGYHNDALLTVELNDISEADRHVAAYHDLPAEIAGLQVTEKKDYNQQKGWNLTTGREYELTLPRSPVLHYTLADDSWFAVRPSGTEPKVKFYLSAAASTAGDAENKMARLRKAVLAISGDQS